MREKLTNVAKKFFTDINNPNTCDNNYLSGLNIWIGASCHKKDILALAHTYQDVLNDLGATTILSEKSCEQHFGNVVQEQLTKVDYIIMFAVTPGISAKALYLCWKSSNKEFLVTDKLFIYTSSPFATGFICDQITQHGGTIRYLEQSAFRKNKDNLFKKCLGDIYSNELNRKRMNESKQSEFKPTIGIVTALQLEFDAVKEILANPRQDLKRESNSSYHEYHHGTITSIHNGEHNVVLACSGVGNNKSAALAADLLHKYSSVQVIFMVGIAAGVPDEKNGELHVRLGDIVVCNEFGVIQYDMVKQNTEKTEYNHSPRPPSHAWLTRANHCIANPKKEFAYWHYLDEILNKKSHRRPSKAPLKDSPWIEGKGAATQPKDSNRTPNRPKIHTGAIASANIVLKCAETRDELKEKFKVKAVEMEASGIAEVTWQSTKEYFVIRGICDFANDDKNKLWQPYAAAAAAAFTRELIESMPLTS